MKFEKLSFINLGKNSTVEAAGKAIFGNCASHIQRNFDLFEQHSDPQALMQIRVGLRRVRVALKIFKQVLPSTIRKPLKDRAKHFSSELGRARDMDVLLAGYLSAEGLDTACLPALDILRALVMGGRAGEYDIVQQDIFQGDFQNFLNDLKQLSEGNWQQDQAAKTRAVLASPVEAFAIQTLVAGARHLRKMDVARADLSNDEIHKLRRRVKKARYQLRFLISVCSPEPAGELLRLLRALQDCLGDLRDVTQSRQLIADLTDRMKAADYAAILDLDAMLTVRAARAFDAGMNTFDRLWRDYLDLDGTEKALIPS